MINMGLQLRATHDTKINEVSSRSHTVFTINVLQKDVSNGSTLKGTLNLVDLAGSERLKKSESSGQRLKEALHINTSLTALGKVVLSLDPSSNLSHVPYRDSKLTRLLQNSLGGNSYTTLVATVQPVAEYAEESLSTLMFANRCRNVQNTPSVNYAAASSPKKGGGAGAGSGGGGGFGGGGSGGGGPDGGGAGPLSEEGAKKMSSEIALLKKQLQLSASQQSLAADPNLRVLEVLKQLGITAEVQPDGTLKLPDGRVIGTPLAVANEGDKAGNAGNAASATGALGGSNGGSSGQEFEQMMSGASMELQELVADLTRQAAAMKVKMRQRKEETEKVKADLVEQKAAHSQAVVAIKLANQKLSTDLASKARKLGELEAALREAHGNQITELVGNNQKILQEQHNLLQNCRQNLPNADLLADARRANQRITAEERVKFQKSLTALEFGRTAEIENVKQQYEFWLGKKQREAEKFVEDFNTYRNKKNETIEEYEKELVELFEYGSGMKTIVDTMSLGGFNMRKTRSGFVPVIPGELAVPDILDDRGALGRTIELVRKREEAAERERDVKGRATRALEKVGDMFAKPGGREAGGGREGRRDGGTAAKAGLAGPAKRGLRAANRPRTANARLRGEGREDIWSRVPPGDDDGDDGDDDATTDTRIDGEGSVAFTAENEVDMASNVSEIGSVDDLKDTVVRLRKYARGLTEKRTMARTLNADLSSDETVNYIKHLEDEKRKYSGQARDASRQLRDLRIAYEALGRRGGGEEEGGGNRERGHSMHSKGRRPQSAKVGRR